ncbi:MAG: TIGR03862 family flavoprotein [Methylococcales bacterium]|nr:TIGR03862 family flavoprotein [Methylococcales bacterium]
MRFLNNEDLPTVAIIGGGPAGLMAAEVLSHAGVKIDLYDAMPSVGRKFLMAGKGGLNISHAEDVETFLSRYAERRGHLEPMLMAFSPDALRSWVQGLGFDTFVGSSGRVFPIEMKAAPLLRAWLQRLRRAGVVFYVRHRWLGWDDNNVLRFETPQGEQLITADAVVLALGGGSWARLGSTGAWVELLQQRGVETAPLKPANCGFDVDWSEHFRSRFAGQPLKGVSLSLESKASEYKPRFVFQKGDFVVTATGVEGGLIYTASAQCRDSCDATGSAIIHLDLLPDKAVSMIVAKLTQPRGKDSMANHLRKRLGITGVKAGLLRELLPAAVFNHPENLALAIKALPIKLLAPRPIDEAISTAGGVTFEAVNKQLMIQNVAGVFCAGEMLDWEAPTGGYLLTACFASGRTAGEGVLKWLQQ